MNKKLRIVLLSIIGFLIITLTTTYAYWYVVRHQTNSNIVKTACLDISLTNEQNDINLTNQFPMSDEEGMKLTPYTFTVTNNCNKSIDYQVNLEALNDSDSKIESSSIKVSLNDNTTLLSNKETRETTLENAYTSYQLMYGRLEASGSENHSLRLWLDKDASTEEMNKTFESKIVLVAGQGIENPFDEGTFAYNIVGNAGGTSFITTINDFSSVTSAKYAAVHQTRDDLGTSYYYRGAPLNNYVKFGEWSEDVVEIRGYYSETSSNYRAYTTLEACSTAASYNKNCSEFVYGNKGDDMYWRIIRINGDGTIRIIYDGTEAVSNGTSHTATIGTTAYNTNSDNAKYVGYTYENDEGNQTDSTIKTFIDAWYDTNLEINYGAYIADSIFCNDRSVADTYNNITYYGAYDRLYINKTPQLTCSQTTDKYTINTEYGNGYLTNPVGLITADEITAAGGLAYITNTSLYLANSTNWYWTSTPNSFSGSYASLWNVNGDGSMYDNYGDAKNNRGGARPVISLKVDVKFTGEGTIDNPYEIITE